MPTTPPSLALASTRTARKGWRRCVNAVFIAGAVAVLASSASPADADMKKKAKPAASAKQATSAKPGGSAKPKASASAAATVPGARTPAGGTCDKDPNNCGAAGEMCKDNLCVCIGPDNVRCVKPTAANKDCTNVKDNADHCGACGHACPARAECTDGKCVACQPGFSVCLGQPVDPHGLRSCVDLKNDESNCGKCDRSCPDSWGCVNGHCEP